MEGECAFHNILQTLNIWFETVFNANGYFQLPQHRHCSRDYCQPVRAQRSCTPPRILPPSCISQCPAARLLSEPYSHWPTFLPPEASQWARAQRDDAGGSTHSMTWWECTWITKQRTMPEIPLSCLSWYIFFGVKFLGCVKLKIQWTLWTCRGRPHAKKDMGNFCGVMQIEGVDQLDRSESDQKGICCFNRRARRFAVRQHTVL